MTSRWQPLCAPLGRADKKSGEGVSTATRPLFAVPLEDPCVRAGRAIATGIALLALVVVAGAVAISRVDPGAVRDFLTDSARQVTGLSLIHI